MKIAIIEDERPAAEKLKKELVSIDRNIEVQVLLDSISASVSWLKQMGSPDLIFMDIELTDGVSFSLFEQVRVECPVIFITAYDEYWQEAFEHNSIDYLLKPVQKENLKNALHKYEKLKQYFAANLQRLTDWRSDRSENKIKTRFLVQRGTDFISIRTEDIAYFYATHKLVCLVDMRGQKFILDGSLSDIEELVDAQLFYRTNRKYLVNLNAIKRIRSYPKGKLLIEVEPAVEEELIVSQESAAGFKQWLEQ
jgi:DNA-binding LytR/AlgR family response regulator